jgi:hypothetical protein
VKAGVIFICSGEEGLTAKSETDEQTSARGQSQNTVQTLTSGHVRFCLTFMSTCSFSETDALEKISK